MKAGLRCVLGSEQPQAQDPAIWLHLDCRGNDTCFEPASIFWGRFLGLSGSWEHPVCSPSCAAAMARSIMHLGFSSAASPAQDSAWEFDFSI